MTAYGTDSSLMTLTSWFLLLRYEAYSISKQLHATLNMTINNDVSTCHDGFMSVSMPKKEFTDLPFTIYVQEEHGGYYQAIAVGNQCQYLLRETEALIILSVASNGCFVRRQKYITNLTVVILEYAKEGRLKIVKTITVTCERKPKEEKNTNEYPPVSRNLLCNKDGFKVTIPMNVTVPPPSYSLTLHCSFVLVHSTHMGINVQAEQSENPSTLKSEGILKTEMRFAKDSNFRSFYSSRDPLVTELGLPVYVEVFVLKHEDGDLVLVLEDCWATSTKNPFDPQRWNLLVKGCPFSGDTHKTVVLPVVPCREIKNPSLHKWFVVKMFSFVKPQTFKRLNDPLQMHFHCSVEICKGPNCSQLCRNGQRRKL